MEDLRHLDACRPEVPTDMPSPMKEVVTPLTWQEWNRDLASHPVQKLREYVVNGLRWGFRIGFDYAQAACQKSSGNLARTSPKSSVIILP